MGALLLPFLIGMPSTWADEAQEKVDVGTVQRTAQQRIGGSDRYAVGANVSRWLPGGDGSEVVVASGEVFSDALSAGPMAAARSMRLLLTSGESLPSTVQAELARQKPAHIVIAGGPATVSTQVETQLAKVAPVTRIGGADRYVVAATIASQWPTSEYAVVASGELFSDALSAGPLAAKLNAPLLLVGSDTLPPSIAERLQLLSPRQVIVLGGSDTISAAVLAEIAAVTGVQPHRVGGADRYAVAADTARQYFQGADTVAMASGEVFSDGLTGTPLAASYDAPILLSTGSCTPVDTADSLARMAPAHIFYVGGSSSITRNPAACGTSLVRAATNPPSAALTEVPLGSPAEEAVYFVPIRTTS